MTDPMELVGRLAQRAADYRTGGPSSEHTAIMLDEAAACIREMVEWRPVESHPAYSVSRDGRVRRGDRILGQWLNGNGYAMVRLSGPRTTARVHQLVARAFLPPDAARPFVNHKNNARADNRVENLEWCTQAENLSHADRQGRMRRDYWVGRRSPSAKLTDQTAAMIRAAAASGQSYSQIAERFGTNKRTVGRIVNNQTYLPPAPGAEDE